MTRVPAPQSRSARTRPGGRRALAPGVLAALVLLAACQPETQGTPEPPRPVRALTIEEAAGGRTLSLSGTIAAQNEVNLSFRIGGRMVERTVGVGDTVETGEEIARLDAINEENALLSARANLTATEARLVEAELDFGRQKHLYERNVVARARLDNASQVLQSAQAAVDDAAARFEIARTRLDDTILRADSPGVVTRVGAEAGEVIQPGQAILTLAREEGIDAVFDAPASFFGQVTRYMPITVALTIDPGVTAEGLIREVAPQADRTTGTFRVRVGLHDVPEEMRLGSTVTGRTEVAGGTAVLIPATALTSLDGNPAVWVVDGTSNTVDLRPIEIGEHRPSEVEVDAGLAPGEVVVTAGVQALRPGQEVRVQASGT